MPFEKVPKGKKLVTHRSLIRESLMARAAALKVAGATDAETAKACGVSTATIRTWRQNERYIAFMEGFVEATAKAVETMLEVGEKKASAVMVEALDAETSEGRPDWNIRLQAARRLLDMQGQRGRPTEKQEINQTTREIRGDMTEALTTALRDPGVQRWIAESGILKQLPPPSVPPESQEEDIQDAEYEVVQEPSDTTDGGTE